MAKYIHMGHPLFTHHNHGISSETVQKATTEPTTVRFEQLAYWNGAHLTAPLIMIAGGYAFGFNHNTYLIFEDHEDDFRSHMKDLMVIAGHTHHLRGASPIEVNVKAVIRENNKDLLDFIDGDMHTWMTIGTDRSDDLYPTFIARWSPSYA